MPLIPSDDIVFDNGDSGSLTCTQNTAKRYGQRRRITGAWSRAQVADIAAGLFDEIWATGTDDQGRLIIVGREVGLSRLLIWRDGTLVVDKLMKDDGSDREVRPTAIQDALRGSSDEVADICFQPVGASVWDGVVQIQFECYSYNDDLSDRSNAANWTRNRWGTVVYDGENFDVVDVGHGSPESLPANTISSIGRVWSNTTKTLTMDGVEEEEAWSAWSNYRLNKNTTGQPTAGNDLFMIRRHRKVGGTWVHDGILQVVSAVNIGMHIHGGTLYEWLAGMCVDVMFGDGADNNGCRRIYRSDQDYLAGASAVANASGNVFSLGTGWTEVSQLQGWTRGTVLPQRVGYQGFRPIDTGDGWIHVFCDEQPEQVLKYRKPTDLVDIDTLSYEMSHKLVGFASPESIGSFGWIGFCPTVRYWNGGTQQEIYWGVNPNKATYGNDTPRQQTAGRVWRLQVGVNEWTQVYSGPQYDQSQFPVQAHPFGGFMLCDRDGTGVFRHFPGSEIAVEPLSISPGGTNLMRETNVVQGTATGNTVMAGQHIVNDIGLAANHPDSPVDDNFFDCQIEANNGTGLNPQFTGAAVPRALGKLTGVGLWQTFVACTSNLQSTSFRFQLRDSSSGRVPLTASYDEGSGPVDFVRYRFTPYIGLSALEVVPFSFEIQMDGLYRQLDGSNTIDQVQDGLAPRDTYKPSLQVNNFQNTGQGVWAAWQGAVQYAGFYEDPDDYITKVVPYDSTAPDDVAEVALTSEAEWSTLVIGSLHPNGWDSSLIFLTDNKPMFTLIDESSGAYLMIESDIVNMTIRATYHDGTTTQTNTIDANEFVRLDQIIVAVSKTPTDLNVSVSHGAAEADSTTFSVAGDTFVPDKILLGQNNDGSKVAAYDFVKVQHIGEGRSVSDLFEAMQALGFSVPGESGNESSVLRGSMAFGSLAR